MKEPKTTGKAQVLARQTEEAPSTRQNYGKGVEMLLDNATQEELSALTQALEQMTHRLVRLAFLVDSISEKQVSDANQESTEKDLQDAHEFDLIKPPLLSN